MGVTSDEERLFTRSFIEIGTRIEQPKLTAAFWSRSTVKPDFPQGGGAQSKRSKSWCVSARVVLQGGGYFLKN